MRLAPIVACSLLVAPGTASAGRTFYGWLFGSEVMPERGAELQTWITDENDKSGSLEDHSRNTQLWVAPLIGITDQLELVLPVEMQWTKDATPGSARTTFYSYGAELRYRFVSQDPVDKPAFAPLLRVGVKRLITDRDTLEPSVDLVASYDFTNCLQVLVDVGFVADVSTNGKHFVDPNTMANSAAHFELHPGIGFSGRVVSDLRLGAEFYSELPLDHYDGSSWAVLGPDLAWTHGRSWVSATFGIGVYQIRDAGRIQWGIAF